MTVMFPIWTGALLGWTPVEVGYVLVVIERTSITWRARVLMASGERTAAAALARCPRAASRLSLARSTARETPARSAGGRAG